MSTAEAGDVVNKIKLELPPEIREGAQGPPTVNLARMVGPGLVDMAKVVECPTTDNLVNITSDETVKNINDCKPERETSGNHKVRNIIMKIEAGRPTDSKIAKTLRSTKSKSESIMKLQSSPSCKKQKTTKKNK